MSFKICENKKSFDARIKEIEEISHTSDLYLNTKLTKSKKQDGTLVSWLKWVICLVIPRLHIAQTAPLKVAREVGKFAEKHQEFLAKKDKVALIEAVEKLKNKCHKHLKGKEKALDEIIAKIKTLTLKAPPQKMLEMDDLPQEMLDHVLSKLGGKDYENCLRVDWEWNETIVQIAKKKEARLIKNFIQFVIDHYSIHREPFTPPSKFCEDKALMHLESIKNNLNFSQITSLPQLKIAIYCEKIKFLIFMQSYHVKALETLKDQIKGLESPWLFDDIFSISINNRKYILESIRKLVEKGLIDKAAEVEKLLDEPLSPLGRISLELIEKGQYEQAFKIADKTASYSQSIVRDISLQFIKKGQCDKAIEISRKIKDESFLKTVNQALSKFIIVLAKNNQFEEALTIANAISEEWSKSLSLAEVSKALLQAGHLERALEIANAIFKEYYKSRALADISGALVQAGHFERAAEIADAISDERPKSDALRDISEALVQAAHFEKALEVANAIPGEYSKSKTLANIFEALIQAGRLERALEVANAISDERPKSEALANISKVLARSGEFEKALEIANSISKSYYKSNALADISKAFAEAGDFERALEISETVSHKDYKNLALLHIPEALAQAGYFERALKIADAITEEWCKSCALDHISIALAQAGHFEKALEIADTISEKEYKSLALADISKALAQAGHFGRALEIANAIPEDYYKSNALADISTALAQAGHFKKAAEIANTILNEKLKNKTLAIISRMSAAADQSEQDRS
ncbi:hypothetical protein [Parachlamydia sp. AcF125]|uniref:tetratricopeptide repeat protein n=1 Tax=Parachlamydia sp. AcF125 TaxID=2795736 RepID=UPI001BC96BFD|nr:hypothetical protein [Parachlamydia sp. AcF125]MBS4168088.1 hypothetical protein [Parachlamydia sp. AcF125]